LDSDFAPATILSDPVEVPHSVRAIGILPFPYIITAMGVMAALAVLQRLLRHRRGVMGLSTLASSRRASSAAW